MPLKKRSEEELKEYLFGHRLFVQINAQWPHRNLDFEFDMMIEHHKSGACKCHPGGGLPKNIVAAWKNWVPFTQQDPKIVEARRREAEAESMRRNNVDPQKPISEEGLRKLDEMRKRWGIKKM